MSHGLCMFDEDLRPIVLNTQFATLFGVAHAEPGKPAACLHEIAPEIAARLQHNVLAGHAAAFEVDCRGRTVAVVQRPMPNGGWVATFEDVTAERQAQAHIVHMARHDGLTNLPNRVAFRDCIQEALRARQADGGMLAVMCLDLDHFKEVNDTLGIPAGMPCCVRRRSVSLPASARPTWSPDSAATSLPS